MAFYRENTLRRRGREEVRCPGDDSRPASLMAGAQAGPVVAVEILVEQYVFSRHGLPLWLSPRSWRGRSRSGGALIQYNSLIALAPVNSAILQQITGWPPENRAASLSPSRSHVRKVLPIRQGRTQVHAPQFRYIATNWTNFEVASGRRDRKPTGRSDAAVMDVGRWPTYDHPR